MDIIIGGCFIGKNSEAFQFL